MVPHRSIKNIKSMHIQSKDVRVGILKAEKVIVTLKIGKAVGTEGVYAEIFKKQCPNGHPIPEQ